MTNTTEEFNKSIESTCEYAVRNSSSLADAFQACEGLFPSFALSQFFEIDRVLTQRWIKEAASTQSSTSEPDHDASFVLSTWEFQKEQVQALSSRAWHPKSRVCLLGTPSLVRHLPVASESRPHVLIDLRTPDTKFDGNVLHLAYDINMLNGIEFCGAFDTCFLDPPWYTENYLKWIDVAASYCCNGGVIAFVLLGRLTRPSAANDRERILNYCHAIGLNPIVYKNFVLYESPAFERHMLRRAGIPPVLWKRADLVIATLDRLATRPGGAVSLLPLTPFRQARFSGLSIDVVFDRYERNSQDSLLVAEGGYWMKTPSRRELGLRDCNVFTSNGARFIAPRPVDLFANLASLQRADTSSIREGLRRLGFPLGVLAEREDAYEVTI